MELDDETVNKMILDRPPTSQDVINQLPLEYYLPEGMTHPKLIIQHGSSEVLEINKPGSSDKESRRLWNDTFTPSC